MRIILQGVMFCIIIYSLFANMKKESRGLNLIGALINFFILFFGGFFEELIIFIRSIF